MKSEKWAPQALKAILVGYDGHTIYRVHIKEQKKVIRIKTYESSKTTKLRNLPNFLTTLKIYQHFKSSFWKTTMIKS